MRAMVDADTCTGCGLCVELCPAVFEMGDEVVTVIANSVPEDSSDDCLEARDACPVEAISVMDD